MTARAWFDLLVFGFAGGSVAIAVVLLLLHALGRIEDGGR
jgi:hypothetical protein